MASLLLYRTAALIAVGIMAGGVHSLIYSRGHGPIILRLKEEPPRSPKPVDKTPGTSDGANVQPPPPPPPATSPSKLPLHITIEDAKSLYEAKTPAPFIDARHLEDYEAGHIKDALLLNSDDFLAGKSVEVLGYLDKDKPFVVYCSGGMCDASENLVMLLQQAGYKDPHIMTDGFPGWQKAGLPTATGKPLVGGGG